MVGEADLEEGCRRHRRGQRSVSWSPEGNNILAPERGAGGRSAEDDRSLRGRLRHEDAGDGESGENGRAHQSAA